MGGILCGSTQHQKSIYRWTAIFNVLIFRISLKFISIGGFYIFFFLLCLFSSTEYNVHLLYCSHIKKKGYTMEKIMLRIFKKKDAIAKWRAINIWIWSSHAHLHANCQFYCSNLLMHATICCNFYITHIEIIRIQIK